MTTLHQSEPSGRLLSLDVARGITIAFMIMVNNNGGDGSWGFMNHAAWNGLTATDLVFPTFVFVMGISVVFAIEARLARGVARRELIRHAMRRSWPCARILCPGWTASCSRITCIASRRTITCAIRKGS